MTTLYDDVVRQLAGITHLNLVPASVQRAGNSAAGLRPDGERQLGEFAIALSHSFAWAEATVVVDSYAGALVRRVSDRVTADPSEWAAIIEEAAPRVKVSIYANEATVNLHDLPDEPWRTFEIECSERLPRIGGEDAVSGALIRAGGVCLSLMVAALGLEVSDEAPPGDHEGAAVQVLADRYERSPLNRERCIRHWGTMCHVCGFSFEAAYGPDGSGFIEVHHLLPLADQGGERELDPTRDLVPLCSNCHSMAHRRRPPFGPNDLREMISRQRPADDSDPTAASLHGVLGAET